MRTNTGLGFQYLLLLQCVVKIWFDIVNFLLTILAQLKWSVSRSHL